MRWDACFLKELHELFLESLSLLRLDFDQLLCDFPILRQELRECIDS